jgi:DNA-binding response OmpR family regulator
MEILVVEDESAIADFLARGLRAEGFAVTVAGDGPRGERLALGSSFDLVVLDRMLPGRDGIEVLRAIRRQRPTLPVILLTARGEVGDRVAGLDAGATDYLAKPFAFDELVARVRAHLRQAVAEAGGALEVAGIRLDPLARRAEREGAAVSLSQREADLLAHLMRHPGTVCSQRELLGAVWGSEQTDTNVASVYVGYLRRKLDRPGSPAPIETVRGAGYRLRDRP